MSYASEEYINQSEAEQVGGSITALPSQMSEAQYQYILTLLDTCILADVQKDKIIEGLDHTTTSDMANKIIIELQQLQKNPLDRIREGELLLAKDLKIAVRKAVEDPNT
jgi:hypothetical protein